MIDCSHLQTLDSTLNIILHFTFITSKIVILPKQKNQIDVNKYLIF